MNKRIITLLTALMALSACNGTWLRYDTAQKDRAYFKVSGITNVYSFALMSEDEMEVSFPVYILGTPKPEDREICCKTSGEGVDFETGKLIIPAGSVEGNISFKIRRSASLLGVERMVTASIVEDEAFLRMDADSTNVKAIISPDLKFYVTDGEPACPEWWKTASGGVDYEWGMYYGIYFPAKFRKMLEYYHAIGERNPLLYEELVAKYGENIDKEGLPRSFMSSQDQSIWATYVLIPLHSYYQEYYKEHPENAEKFANAGDLTSQTWGDPMRLLR